MERIPGGAWSDAFSAAWSSAHISFAQPLIWDSVYLAPRKRGRGAGSVLSAERGPAPAAPPPAKRRKTKAKSERAK